MKSKVFTPFKRVRSMINVLRKSNVIFSMFKDVWSGQYKMPVGRLVLFILALAYMIWPIDIIPDMFFVVGWLDDLLIFGYVSKFMEEELLKYKQRNAYIAGEPVVLPEKWK